jgi:hypothetical protein
MSNATKSVLNLVTYVPKPGKEEELRELVEKHWPALDAVGLASPMKPTIWRAYDIREHRTYFVELFAWKDETSSDIAHQTPEVMAIWEPMGPILEKLTIAKVEPLGVTAAG